MGDPLAATEAKFTARVLGGSGRELIVMRDGEELASSEVTSDDFTYEFEADRAGDYRLQLQRGMAIDALTNPITLGAAPLRIEARVKPRRTKARRKKRRFAFRVSLLAQDRVLPLAGAVVRFRGRRTTTGPAGRAAVRVRVRRPGRYRAKVTRPGLKPARLRVKVKR